MSLLSVAFKVSPKPHQTLGGISVVTGGREAESCWSDGRAFAGGFCVDTGTHERVANWSPDSVATVDPCDLGTDPRNGPFAGIPHGVVFLRCPAR